MRCRPVLHKNRDTAPRLAHHRTHSRLGVSTGENTCPTREAVPFRPGLTLPVHLPKMYPNTSIEKG